MAEAQPRTRKNRLKRDWKFMDTEHVGDDSFPETCPRCGWPCTHLVRAYWDSPWNQWGGICSQCIKVAVHAFERDGWPPDPRDPTAKKKKADYEPPPSLFEK